MQEQIFYHNQNLIIPKTASSTQSITFEFPKAHLDSLTLSELQNMPVRWVRTEAELYELIDEIDTVDRVALDTEFIKRNTYFPILALVQVNTGRAIYLVDAPRLDLTDFWQALQEVPEMIWYACGEDLGIFYLLADCPPLNNVIDVQIGVAYLTTNLQVSYARSIEEILGVHLTKSESQSDWLMRPLTEEQERYAADDVRYLLVLHDVVMNALKQKNIWQYAKEDGQHYAVQLFEAHHISDDKLYLDSIAPDYTNEQITVLWALTTWREELARSVNQPKTFIVSKQAMREIVSFLPSTIKELARTTINRASLRMYGDEIIKIIQAARSLPIDQRPLMPLPLYTSGDKPFKNELKAATQAHADMLGIPEMLLFKNRWLQGLLQVVATEDMAHLPKDIAGYRHDWVLDVVLPILQRHQSHIKQMMGF